MSSALQRLSHRLGSGVAVPERFGSSNSELDRLIAEMKRREDNVGVDVDTDTQLTAIRKFWDHPVLPTIRDARLICFGLSVPISSRGACIMEDADRFDAVLGERSGIGKWISTPRQFRRCYQGLVSSYFAYDPKREGAPRFGKDNWDSLRKYLSENRRRIETPGSAPEWVSAVAAHHGVFSQDPCRAYATAVLEGNTEVIEALRATLAIPNNSWFLKELVLAQVRAATERGDKGFAELVDELLLELRRVPSIRSEGLALILDRYARIDGCAVHARLRDTAVEWWGNPWLPLTEAAWGRVKPATRELISVWLKSEFIEAFFRKLAVDGAGDHRRAKFWLRYVKQADIRFALGSSARYSRNRDFVALREKMKGLFTELVGATTNNAFVMTIGDLVAVEFGDAGNAFYGYSRRKGEPFDIGRPVSMAVNSHNSLKNSSHSLKLLHKDGIHGFRRWEDLFESELDDLGIWGDERAAERVGIRWTAPRETPAPRGQASTERPLDQSVPPFSRIALSDFAKNHNFRIEDKTGQNGNLWVRTSDADPQVRRVLKEWGFNYKPPKGWWKA